MLDQTGKGNMRQSSAHRAKLTQYPRFGILFLAWTALGVLAYARYSILTGDIGRGVLHELLGWLICYYPWLFFTAVVFRLERRFPLGRLKWLKQVVVLSMAGLCLSYLAYEITIFLNMGIQYVFREPLSLPRSWWLIPLREQALEQALYWFTVGAACVIRNVVELRERERVAAQLALEKSRLESSLRQAELENLRMRLNPHFLFNCLQNIATLSRRDPRTAGLMLTRLGDLLRVALRRDSEPESTLIAEVHLTQAYVSIEKMRFADRLSVLLDIGSGTEQALVPSFLLQPLVENAIKHGLRGGQRSGVIWVNSHRENKELILRVADNGTGLSSEQLTEVEVGIGLGSTCERLARMYAEQHAFSIRELPEGGTEVRISLPLRFKEGVNETSSHDWPACTDRR